LLPRSLTMLLQLQNSYNIYCKRNNIANNEWGGVIRFVLKERHIQITVLAFVYGTEESHNTLSKVREKAVEIQTTYFLNINQLSWYFNTVNKPCFTRSYYFSTVEYWTVFIHSHITRTNMSVKETLCNARQLVNKKKVNVYLSSLMMKVPDHVYVLC
jgi:hypothetical protein